MFNYRFRRISFRLVAIALLACWFAIATSPLLSPIAAQDDDQERTKTFPYTTQLVPGQSTCIVIDRHEIEDSEELTPQEKQAKENWSLPERWVWRQVCTGKEANFLNIFFHAWLFQNKTLGPITITKEIRDDIKKDISKDVIREFEEVQACRQDDNCNKYKSKYKEIELRDAFKDEAFKDELIKTQNKGVREIYSTLKNNQKNIELEVFEEILRGNKIQGDNIEKYLFGKIIKANKFEEILGEKDFKKILRENKINEFHFFASKS